MKIIKIVLTSIIFLIICTSSSLSVPKIIRKVVDVVDGKIAVVYWVDFDGDGQWDCTFAYYDSKLIKYHCRQKAKISITESHSTNVSINVKLTSSELSINFRDDSDLHGKKIIISDYLGNILHQFSTLQRNSSILLPERLQSGMYIVSLIHGDNTVTSYKFLIY